MSNELSRLLKKLSRTDIEKLLAAKDAVETLEKRRAELQKELGDVDKRLAKLVGKAVSGGRRGRKPGRKPGRKAGKKTARGPRVKLEDVVVQVLERSGAAMPFKAILETITSEKLFKSRSKQFDNVLRRTLSTSDKVKRVSRGVYGL